jgi:hypothetical protein
LASAVAVGGRRAWLAYVFVASVGFSTLVGVLLATGIAATRSAGPAAPVAAISRRDDLGREFRTGFGVVAALSVQQSRGLTAKELAGLTHFPSYVPPDRMQVRVSVQLSNVLDRPVDYAAREFRLRAGNGPAIAPSGASIPSGTLQPRAAVDQTLSFIVRRSERRGVPLRLEFREQGAEPPLVIRLGTARPAAAPLPQLKHDHLGHGRSP